MANSSINRTLWYEDRDKRVTVSQEELRAFSAPLVILGEAGMGKSHLLEWLATTEGYARCTARQLINRRNPATLLNGAHTLVIDALDEVSAQKDGDAVDLVLRQLGALDYPHFILSCRVADWRHATGLEAIREQYDREPLELHLQPFSEGDQINFLSATLGPSDAKKVIAHFDGRGLDGLLGNPQTLELISELSASDLPATQGDLFERAIEVMWAEHRDAKATNKPGREAALDAAGAAFAAMILTGSGAIVRSAPANAAEGELALADVRQLPGAGVLEAMLDTRLFKADGSDRFHYWHRRIGEYLGARWLAHQANTPRKRRRLLALFHAYGLVPASLRGIHAWLARDPALADAVIAEDPMGVIQYGDADNLTAENARALIRALEILAEENPQFRNWGPYSLSGIAQHALLADIQRLIATPGVPYGLRLLILQAIKGSPIAPDLAGELRALVLDPKAIFASRSAAGEALADLGGQDWSSILTQLHKAGDNLSVRLAIELFDDIGFGHVSDQLIVDLATQYALGEDRTVGVLYRTENGLPDQRLEGILDGLAEKVRSLGKPNHRPGDYGLTDFAYALIVRRVGIGNVDARRLWSWLVQFDASVGYQREARQQLDVLLQRETDLRRAIQRQVLLDANDDKNIWQRSWRLSRRSLGLQPDQGDVVALFAYLDPANRQDERWRELLQLVRHEGDEGAIVRDAARPFAQHRPDLMTWIDGLAAPRVPEWQLKQEENERKRRSKKAVEWANHRKNFAENLPAMRAGDYGAVINPAKAYLKLFRDIGEDFPAHERVAEWLGQEIADAAHAGFDEFLKQPEPKPSADEIAESHAEGRHWDAGYIVVAALAERLRTGLGFADLKDERLMAGLFELWQGSIDEHAGIAGLKDSVIQALRERNAWETALRRFYEPQFQKRRAHVSGLYAVMRGQDDDGLASDLAADWLSRFESLPTEPESELIDRILRSGRREDLREISLRKLGLTDVESRLVWDAVGIVVDFDATVARLAESAVPANLLWHLRNRTTGRYDEGPNVELSPAQLCWIIATFRTLWPEAPRPSGTTMGDDNLWDASDYLSSLIRRLGNDTHPAAVAALAQLLDAEPDGYTEFLKAVRAEQTRKLVEAAYVPPSLAAVGAIATDRAPADATDLQALMFDELAVVQAKIRSDDAESWRGFFDHSGPLNEESCRDHLLGLLRQGCDGVVLTPEAHVGGDREVDIACSVGTLRLPIEIKGQWHPELWRGIDNQLDHFYSKDWRAGGRGIYLVLWFGSQVPDNKKLRSPGQGRESPTNAVELRAMLEIGSRAVEDGRIEIFVLDLSRQ
jgi:hypothetical protein